MSTFYTVWYMKPKHFRAGIMGELPANDLSTHISLGKVTVAFVEPHNIEKALEWIYYSHQAEVWSPNGEARPLIERLGLQHTSMSVGDVIEHDGEFWVVATIGFKKLEGIKHNSTV